MRTTPRVLPLVRRGLRAASAALLVAACSTSTTAGVERSAVASDAAVPTLSRPLPPSADGAVRGIVDALDADEADPDPGEGSGASARPREVLLFGDSVARLLVDDMVRVLDDRLVLDAVDCRRIDIGFTGPCGGVPAGQVVDAGIDDLEALVSGLRDDDAVPDVAVIVLANNSSLRRADLDAAMAVLHDVPVVAWVNTRIDGFGRQDPNNALLDDLADRDDRAVVVDWFGASESRDWLHDHVHPNDAGQVALSELVADVIDAACSPDCDRVAS